MNKLLKETTKKVVAFLVMFSFAFVSMGGVTFIAQNADAQVVPTASVSGLVFHDLNGNGDQDSGELGLPDFIVLMKCGDETIATTTNSEGIYIFSEIVTPQSCDVSMEETVGWIITKPDGGKYSLNLEDGMNIGWASFGLLEAPYCGNNICEEDENSETCSADCGSVPAPTTYVSGLVFHDVNGNGTQDIGDLGLEGKTVELTCDVGGKVTTNSNSSGNYIFSEVTAPNSCTVCPASVLGLTVTKPGGDGCYQLSLAEGQGVGWASFGLLEAPYCGNNICEEDENSETCSADCGSEEEEYDNYCGDGMVNQTWEECDGIDTPEGKQCAEQCQIVTNECSENVFARVNITDGENWGNCNMSSDIYLGQGILPILNGTWFPVYYNGSYIADPDLDTYENVPGLAVERSAGKVTVRMYGSHTDDSKEHIQGNIEFWNSSASTILNETGQNKLENPEDTIVEIQSDQDEMWLDSGISYFWMTVTTADDGYITTYEKPVCEVPVVNTPPIITLTQSVVAIPFGGSFVPMDYATANDAEDGDITGSIIVSGDGVDTNISGTYHVVYNVVDSENEPAVTKTLEVIVDKESLPVVYQCNDGIDNDQDGFVDMNDYGCESETDDDEYNAPPIPTPTPTPTPTVPPTSGGGGGGGSIPILTIPDKGICTVDGNNVAHFNYRTNMPATTQVVCDTTSHNSMGSKPYYGYPLHTEEHDLLNNRVLIHKAELKLDLGAGPYFCRVIADGSYPPGGVKEEITCVVPQPEMVVPAIPPVVEDSCEFIKGFAWPSRNSRSMENNPVEIAKWETMLNRHGDVPVAVDGIYSDKDVVAMKTWQAKYGEEVLVIWGLKANQPTGNGYITSRRIMNWLECGYKAPLTQKELAEIERVKKLNQEKGKSYPVKISSEKAKNEDL